MLQVKIYIMSIKQVNCIKKLFCIVNFIVIFSTLLNGQNSYKPLLLGKSSPYYEDQDRLYHQIESTAAMFKNDPNALLAVRVCSTDPLPIAYVNAAGIDWVIKQFNEQINALRKQTYPVDIPASRVYYLRNDTGCGSYRNVNLTEYWFVPSDADFPEFIEFSKPENILEKTLIFSSQIDVRLIAPDKPENFISLTTAGYETFKVNLIKKLREDKTSLVLINYPSSGIAQKIIFDKSNKLKMFLTKYGIRPQRIFVKQSPKDDFNNHSDSELFPNVTVFTGS